MKLFKIKLDTREVENLLLDKGYRPNFNHKKELIVDGNDIKNVIDILKSNNIKFTIY